MRSLIALALVAAGCGGPAWSTARTTDGWVPLSAWAAGGDVYFAGGGLGSGDGGHLLRYRGGNFQEVGLPASTPSLWWVTARAPGDVWAVGEQGTILHGDGASFALVASPTPLTLYGVWAAAADDAWAVGGDPGNQSGVILRWNGSAWAIVPTPSLPGAGTWFKVWGASAQAVFFVGQGGRIARWDGASFQLLPSGLPASASLLTVSGRAPDDVYAVGGFGQGIALHFDGAAWSTVSGFDPSRENGLAGVSVSGAGDVLLTGLAGGKIRRAAGAWSDDTQAPPREDFHAALLLSVDDGWAVGGNYVAPAPAKRTGTIARYAR